MVKGWLVTLPDSTGSCGHSDYFQPFVQADSSGSDGGQLPMLSKGASAAEGNLNPFPGLQRVGSILRDASLEVPGP